MVLAVGWSKNDRPNVFACGTEGGFRLKSGIFRQNTFKIAVCKAVVALCGKSMGQISKKLDIFLKNYLNIVDDLQKTVIKSTH